MTHQPQRPTGPYDFHDVRFMPRKHEIMAVVQTLPKGVDANVAVPDTYVKRWPFDTTRKNPIYFMISVMNHQIATGAFREDEAWEWNPYSTSERRGESEG